MFKRIFLWIAMNIAVMIVLTIFIYILGLFGIKVSSNTYLGLFIISAVIGFAGSFISLFMSKWMAKKAYNIRLITASDLNMLNEKERLVYDTVSNLSERNHIKMPEVGIYESSEPNAFATGATKNSSLVAVSSGLLDMMDKDAIEGVVGHEMAHVLNGDMVTMTLLQGVLNTFVVFFSKIIANIVANSVDENYAGIARFAVDILLQIVFGFLASFIAMWFSRYREFKADAGSAYYVGKEKMIAGLQALKDMQNSIAKDDPTYSSMQISSKKTSGFMKLLSSHPDLDDRIKALEDLKM
ncbi:zinc metalloprotease HtpX [Candidatus Gracilibacteria bacterium GN02-872]|nr:zinc metalloprotease HtpX [Candidatus Gracilibacteria bacterium GN02-872]